MSNSINEIYLKDVISQFRSCKMLAEKAIAQVSDTDFFHQPDAFSSSIAIIVKHIAGNMRSRWTDFLESDGEKTDRNRDGEFEITNESRASLMDYWEENWQLLFTTLESLTPADLAKVIRIRGVENYVIYAINRQLGHYSYHIGQIVYIARHLCGENWQTLSIAKGQSEQFNKQNWGNRRKVQLGSEK